MKGGISEKRTRQEHRNHQINSVYVYPYLRMVDAGGL